MGFHAVLSPSGASRWIACNPSARFEEKFPDSTSDYAKEGTLAHSLGELYIKRRLGKVQQKVYDKELAGIMANDLYKPEMKAHCDNYATYVLEKFNSYENAMIYLETRVDITEYIPEGFGTVDVSIISGNTLEIIDLKYGKGVPVTAERNAQMMCYALGAFKKFSLLYDIDVIKMTIFQPRLDSISEWEITEGTLFGWANSTLRQSAERAWKGEGEFNPGDHCRFCRAKPQCKALMIYTNGVAANVFENAMINLKTYGAEQMTPEETSKVLENALMIENWLTAVKEYALEQALNKGVEWPGMKLVEGKSNRIYADPVDVATKLVAAGYSIDQIFKPSELLGITKMTAELGTADFNRLLTDLIVKPAGKPTLVSVADKRPALNSNAAAADVFKDVKIPRSL